jgi:periplasmic divalent cation tolerance protein
MECSLAMTTTATREDAETLAEAIVADKLAACVQIAEITSVYEWEGRPNKSREFLLLIKGRTDRFPELRDFVLARHPYELPELVRLDIADGNPAYLAWLRG